MSESTECGCSRTVKLCLACGGHHEWVWPCPQTPAEGDGND